MPDLRFRRDDGYIQPADYGENQNKVWVALNCYIDDIPKGAAEFMDLTISDEASPAAQRLSLQEAMDWTRNANWHHQSYHWRPYVLILGRAVGKLSPPWYLLPDRPSPLTIVGRHWILDPETQNDYVADISAVRQAIDEIILHEEYGSDSPRPKKFDMELLHGFYETEAEAQGAARAAKEAMLDMLAFLNWWISCIPSRANWLSKESHNLVKDIGLKNMRKRGVLLKLSRDWHQINLPALVRDRVPVFYPWTSNEMSDRRFTRLSPNFLCTYVDKVRKMHNPELTYLELPELQRQFPDIRQYNEFLEEKDEEVTGEEPADIKTDDPDIFIVDFRGWRRRFVDDKGQQQAYAEEFKAKKTYTDSSREVTFARWRHLDEMSVDCHPSLDSEPLVELRELWKGQYVPEVAAQEEVTRDLVREPSIYETARDESSPTSLASRIGITLAERISSPSPMDSSKPQRPEPLIQRISVPHSLSKQVTHVLEDEAMDVDRLTPDSTLSLPEPVAGSSSNPATRVVGTGWKKGKGNEIRATSYEDRPTVLQRPVFVSRWSDFEDIRSPMSRSDFIKELKAWGTKLTHDDPAYNHFPRQVQWHPQLLANGYLIIETDDAQFQLRYWALCLPGMDHLRLILERAIEHGVRFAIGIKKDDLAPWKNMRIPDTDCLLAKRVCEPGYVEPELPADLAGGALCDTYMATKGSPECWLFPTENFLCEFCDHYSGEWNAGVEDIYHHIADEIAKSDSLKGRERSEWREYLRRHNCGRYAPLYKVRNSDFQEGKVRIRDGFPLSWHKKEILTIELPERYRPVVRQN
ncbi:hypothetical protein Hypma_011324 [Hypsizygus marmoreus]|uniref:Uncharacterized protein n=1 Tax=Hypsizygus marmoreus TaxID=39966 RepID=A0A369JKZ2_HYPMA|nr:hypothetical protein Hypma_011324 [Hypsizygus marmoreus]